MIEGINLLISIFIGCIVFIYYTNALFKPRTKYLYANISIIVGYMMLYAISSFYQPTLYEEIDINGYSDFIDVFCNNGFCKWNRDRRRDCEL